LLYYEEEGIRIQVTIKNFIASGEIEKESCEFWKNPENIAAKHVVRHILKELKDIGAINLSQSEIGEIANISYGVWLVING